MKVKFLPQDITVEASSDLSLLQIAQKNGVYIKSVCNGQATCAECRVKIVAGENGLIPPTKNELNLIGTAYFIEQKRLSCQVRCFSDLVVDTSEQVDKQKNQNKKARGVRRSAQTETHAVNDTLILQSGKKES